MQHAYNFDGHQRPQTSVLTVHFTFQYSDTPDFPHGKRQRARDIGHKYRKLNWSKRAKRGQ